MKRNNWTNSSGPHQRSCRHRSLGYPPRVRSSRNRRICRRRSLRHKAVGTKLYDGRNLPGRPTAALSGRGDNTLPLLVARIPVLRVRRPATALAARGCAATVGELDERIHGNSEKRRNSLPATFYLGAFRSPIAVRSFFGGRRKIFQRDRNERRPEFFPRHGGGDAEFCPRHGGGDTFFPVHTKKVGRELGGGGTPEMRSMPCLASSIAIQGAELVSIFLGWTPKKSFLSAQKSQKSRVGKGRGSWSATLL